MSSDVRAGFFKAAPMDLRPINDNEIDSVPTRSRERQRPCLVFLLHREPVFSTEWLGLEFLRHVHRSEGLPSDGRIEFFLLFIHG
jgi:hypothetical protein